MKFGVALVALAAASQLRLMHNSFERPHYTLIAPELHPIDLSQYKDDFVVRTPILLRRWTFSDTTTTGYGLKMGSSALWMFR